MRLLAIDTAMAACSAAILDTDTGLVAYESLPMARGHAEALMPQIARVMETARYAFDDLDRIAVTVGPGSFTGLRVGVAAARGLALAAHKPAVGITTLAALAAPLLTIGDGVPVLALIDARNDQAYMQVFGKDGEAMTPPRIAPLAQAFDDLPDGPVRLVGSAATKLAARADRPVITTECAAPDIAWVARLGAAGDPAKLPKPLYLRAPDAKPQQIGHLLQR